MHSLAHLRHLRLMLQSLEIVMMRHQDTTRGILLRILGGHAGAASDGCPPMDALRGASDRRLAAVGDICQLRLCLCFFRPTPCHSRSQHIMIRLDNILLHAGRLVQADYVDPQAFADAFRRYSTCATRVLESRLPPHTSARIKTIIQLNPGMAPCDDGLVLIDKWTPGSLHARAHFSISLLPRVPQVRVRGGSASSPRLPRRPRARLCAVMWLPSQVCCGRQPSA